MRVTDNRYLGERSRFEVALRMIAHEARTCTIRTCTGLSEDRIRRLYATYFNRDGKPTVRRQRGKSPTRTGIYVKNLVNQCEATTLTLLFGAFGLLRITHGRSVPATLDRRSVEFGRRFCVAYETYRDLHQPVPHICFERAWNLHRALAAGDELVLLRCAECDARYVHHLLEIDDRRCPCCKLKGVRPSRRRTAVVASRSLAPAARRPG